MSNREKQAARAIQRETGVKYTQALRQVRSEWNDMCLYHIETPATSNILVEGVGVISVCGPCAGRILGQGQVVCKHCGVPIAAFDDPRPKSGNHKSTCPRRMYGG